MRKSTTVALLLLLLPCGAAWADGVPLFTTTPGAKVAENAALQAARPETKSVQSVVVNRDAVYAKVITATIEGKDYRFIGGEMKGGSPGIRSWSGSDNGNDLGLGVEGRNAFGTIRLDNGRYFELQPRKTGDVLLEAVDTRDYSPAATAAAREAKRKAKP